MSHIVRKVAALLLLLAIPLQVAATSMQSLQCAPAAGSGAYSAHDADAPTNGPGDDGGKIAHHPIVCHQSASAIPIIPRTGAAADCPVFVPSVPLLSSLFVPEQPHRPPFAS